MDARRPSLVCTAFDLPLTYTLYEHTNARKEETMNTKALALAGFIGLLGLSVSPALALEVGVTNTVSNTVTSGHLTICATDDHWDNGVQRTFNLSGDVQLQLGGGGQEGIGGNVNFGGNGLGAGGSLFGDALGYAQISGNGEVSFTTTNFSDHNRDTQEFSGQQTTSSVTTSSATFTNF